MFVHYADGSSREGVILSLRGESMRVAVAGSEDVCEFVLRGNQWFAEAMAVVSFSFPAAAGWDVRGLPTSDNPASLSPSNYRTGRAVS